MKYLCDPHLIPAVMPHDLAELESFVSASAAYTAWIHLDVSDGLFAPSVQWPLNTDEQKLEFASIVRGERALPQGAALEAHLMTQSPREIGELFAHAGVRRVLGHLEAFPTTDAAREALTAWRSAGAQEAGLALLVTTPIEKIDPVADACDVIHLMSIAEIGAQGHAFDERALSRVEEVHAAYPDMMVAVDGGVSEATVEALVRAGANRLIVGNALRSSKRPAQTYAHILDRAMQGCAPLETALV